MYVWQQPALAAERGMTVMRAHAIGDDDMFGVSA